LQLHLLLTPDHLEAGLAFTPHLAHVAFCIDKDGTLLSRPLPPALRGGQQVLRCEESFPIAAAEIIAREVMHTALCRNFSGILLDAPALPCVFALIGQLAPLCRYYKRKLYIPECCAAATQEATVLICTALSGGSLHQRLEEACARYGAERIAPDLQRLMMDFSLPCPTGVGTPLTAEQLRTLQQGHNIYYCSDLCARYFTRQRGSETRFVLFDDADTLQRKTKLAKSLGIGEGFFTWPEVADILPQLFSNEKRKEGEP
jgi:hypothetical protein